MFAASEPPVVISVGNQPIAEISSSSSVNGRVRTWCNLVNTDVNGFVAQVIGHLTSDMHRRSFADLQICVSTILCESGHEELVSYIVGQLASL